MWTNSPCTVEWLNSRRMFYVLTFSKPLLWKGSKEQNTGEIPGRTICGLKYIENSKKKKGIVFLFCVHHMVVFVWNSDSINIK